MNDKKHTPKNLTEKDHVYVVFDQFHWLDPDHLEYCFKGFDYALANYTFLKAAHQDKSLGFTSEENYLKLKRNRCHANTTRE